MFSYVPGHVLSGLRLSAIPGKPAYRTATDLTGESRTVWHPDQSNLDVVFNDVYHLPGGLTLPNPDIRVNQAGYWIKQRLAGTGLAEWLEGTPLRRLGMAHPQPHHMHCLEIYNSFRSGQGPVAVRYTLVWSTPNIKGLGSAELRFSYKTSPKSRPARMVATAQPSALALPGGNSASHLVPGWFATLLTHAPEGEGVIMPAGGRAVIEQQLMPALSEGATPAQLQAIEAFRANILPQLREGGFVAPKTLEDLGEFARQLRQG